MHRYEQLSPVMIIFFVFFLLVVMVMLMSVPVSVIFEAFKLHRREQVELCA